MALLLHLSDPHFGTEVDARVDAVLALAAAERPDLVVVSGDLTQRARRCQFDRAAAFLRAFAPAPVLAVPGNHDVPLYDVATRLLWPYRGWTRVFGADREPRLAVAGVAVAGLDSTRPWRHKHGELSAAQVDAVSAWFATRPPGDLRVVVLHHPLAHVRASDAVNRVRGADAAITAWRAAGVDLVLSGHVHLPYVVPLGTGPADAAAHRRPWAVNAGTAVSHRVRSGAPASVNLVRAGAHGAAVVERWDWDVGAARFAPVAVEALAARAVPVAPARPARAPA